MSRVRERTRADTSIRKISDALKGYLATHKKARASVFRRSPVDIYVRIVDPQFKGKDRAARSTEVWEHLGCLPDRVATDITLLVLVTPAEMKTSGANQEFESPLADDDE